MVHARYEVRLNGRLSDRARNAFPAMSVTSVPTQTIVFGELAGPSDLGDLLARCNAMGIEVLAVRQLPGEEATPPGADAAAVDEAECASAATPPSRPTDPPEAAVVRVRPGQRSGPPPRGCTRR